MLTTWLTDLDSTAAGIAISSANDIVWVFFQNGKITSLSTSTGSVVSEAHIAADSAVVSACIKSDEKLVAARADGSLTVLDARDPGIEPVTLNIDGIKSPDQIIASLADAEIITIIDRAGSPDARLVDINLRDGSVTAERAVTAATGFAVTKIESFEAVVASNAAQWNRGDISSIHGGTLTSWISEIPALGRLTYDPLSKSIFAVHPDLNHVSTISLVDSQVASFGAMTGVGQLLEVQRLPDGRYLLLTTSELSVADALDDLGKHAYIESPAPIFHGSWGRIYFDLGNEPLSYDSIRFEIPDGPTAGFVSYTKENGKGQPAPLLIGGGVPGKYKIVLVDSTTETTVTSATFSITSSWTNDDEGPAGYYYGPAISDSAPGDDPDLPQNLGSHSHIGEWKVLVLMANTSTASWPSATLDADRNSILEHVSTGFDVSGTKSSARQYYEENSGFIASPAQGVTIAVHGNQIFGPVTMPSSWTDLFGQTKNGTGTVTDARWMSKGTSFEAIILQAVRDGVASTNDFRAVNVVIMVPFSPDASGGVGANFVWPHARYTNQYMVDTNAVAAKHNLAQVWVPLDFASHDGRHMFATLSHELGHTLDLPDIYAFDSYSQAVKNRITSDWDLMAGSRDSLPHFSISNKMRQGWVPSTQIIMYDFSGSRAYNDIVRMHASDLVSIPSGAHKAIEMRLGNGWNYYVEYRAIQSGFISDQINPGRQVVITDVTSDDYSAPIIRPPILFVSKDTDGDGPLLGIGKDFEEKDPGTQMELKIEVLTEDADNATVRVTYGSNGKPEPGIRPWRGDASNWQSPDIEVRNVKATAEPARYGNVPWLGHDNTIVAKIRNSGDLLATGVVVDFTVLEFTSGHDGPEERLGFDMQDIAPGATVEFQAPDRWTPPDDANKHYCVIVRIRLYQDPTNPLIVDNNIFNNEARSNYIRFVSATSSPASRVGTLVRLANPFSDQTIVSANVRQTSLDHRVFTTHQYLRVEGKDSRQIQVWDESLINTPQWNPDRNKEPAYKTANAVSIRGYAQIPFPSDCKTPVLTGGVGLTVDVGRATIIKIREISRADVSGQVLFQDDGHPLGSGKILVEMFPLAEEDNREIIGQTELNSDGFFAFKYDTVQDRPELKAVIVHFLGGFAAAPSETKKLSVPL